MPENALADVGFADFVAVLLVETLDSIVASHTGQEERLRALDGAAELTPEEFAAAGITAEMVDAALVRLFPDGQGGTAVVPGGAVPADEALEELGVRLASGDTEGEALTPSGVEAVRGGVTLHLARRQLEAVREVARRGVPRVLVDGGTLRAKVNFTAVRDESEPAPEASTEPEVAPTVTTRALADLSLRSGLTTLSSPLTRGVLDSIRTTRLRVVQPVAETGGTGGPTSTAHVTGEVEIRFRTEL